MRNRNVLWILLLVMILSLSGCKSSNEEAAKDDFGNVEENSSEKNEDTETTKEDSLIEDSSIEDTTIEDSVTNETKELIEVVEIDSGEMARDISAAFEAALNYQEDSSPVDGATEVSNALLRNTQYQLLSIEKDGCRMIVSYPNVAKALKELEENIPKDASEQEWNQQLLLLALNIDESKIEIVESILEFEVEFKDGIWNVIWTKELYDAFSGGLYSVQ